jgi:hypothetical protein
VEPGHTSEVHSGQPVESTRTCTFCAEGVVLAGVPEVVPGFAVDLDAGRDLIDGMSVPSKRR